MPNTHSDITICPLTTPAEMRAVEDVQRAAWGMQERDIVPMHLMVTWVAYGGLLLGALDGEEVVGFVLGFPGLLAPGDERTEWVGTPLQHCSEMLAVRPEAQGQGVGFKLKLAQRAELLAQGVRLATWTFDPLLSRNAHLNLTRLGGIARQYERDLYGPLDGLYAGLPTDRIEVEWWLASEHVETRIERAEKGVRPAKVSGWQKAVGARLLNPSTARGDGLRAPADEVETPAGRYIMVETPADLGAVKAADLALARAWQAQVRELLEGAFDAGYAAAWFSSEHDGEARRSTYILATEKELGLEAIAKGEEE